MSLDCDYNKPFPANLRLLMSDAFGRSKTSMVDLAANIGTTRQAISQYRNGTVAPNTEKLLLIADYFNVSTDFLLGRSTHPNIESLETLAQTFKELAEKIDTHEFGIEIVGALNGLLKNLSDIDSHSLSWFLTSIDELARYALLVEDNVQTLSTDELTEIILSMLKYQTHASAAAESLCHNILMFIRNLVSIKISRDVNVHGMDIAECHKVIEKIYDLMSPGLNTPNIDRLKNKSDDSATDSEIVKKYRDEIIPAMVKKNRLNEKERYETALNIKIEEDTDNG